MAYSDKELQKAKAILENCTLVSHSTKGCYSSRIALWIHYCNTTYNGDDQVTEKRLADYVEWMINSGAAERIRQGSTHIQQVLRNQLQGVLCYWRIQTGNKPDLPDPRTGAIFAAKWNEVVIKYPREGRARRSEPIYGTYKGSHDSGTANGDSAGLQLKTAKHSSSALGHHPDAAYLQYEDHRHQHRRNGHLHDSRTHNGADYNIRDSPGSSRSMKEDSHQHVSLYSQDGYAVVRSQPAPPRSDYYRQFSATPNRDLRDSEYREYHSRHSLRSQSPAASYASRAHDFASIDGSGAGAHGESSSGPVPEMGFDFSFDDGPVFDVSVGDDDPIHASPLLHVEASVTSVTPVLAEPNGSIMTSEDEDEAELLCGAMPETITEYIGTDSKDNGDVQPEGHLLVRSEDVMLHSRMIELNSFASDQERAFHAFGISTWLNRSARSALSLGDFAVEALDVSATPEGDEPREKIAQASVPARDLNPANNPHKYLTLYVRAPTKNTDSDNRTPGLAKYKVACHRHKNPLQCPWGALAAELFRRWHVENDKVPDLGTSSWQSLSIFPDLSGNGNASVSDKLFQKALDGVSKEKLVGSKTISESGYHYAELCGLIRPTVEGIKSLTCVDPLNPDVIDPDVLSILMKTNSGYKPKDKVGSPRFSVLPQLNLQKMIFPWSSSILADVFSGNDNHGQRLATRFLRTLKALRITLLQDAAVLINTPSLKDTIKAHSVFSHSIFSTPEFKEYCATMKEKVSDTEIKDLDTLYTSASDWLMKRNSAPPSTGADYDRLKPTAPRCAPRDPSASKEKPLSSDSRSPKRHLIESLGVSLPGTLNHESEDKSRVDQLSSPHSTAGRVDNKRPRPSWRAESNGIRVSDSYMEAGRHSKRTRRVYNAITNTSNAAAAIESPHPQDSINRRAVDKSASPTPDTGNNGDDASDDIINELRDLRMENSELKLQLRKLELALEQHQLDVQSWMIRMERTIRGYAASAAAATAAASVGSPNTDQRVSSATAAAESDEVAHHMTSPPLQPACNNKTQAKPDTAIASNRQSVSSPIVSPQTTTPKIASQIGNPTTASFPALSNTGNRLSQASVSSAAYPGQQHARAPHQKLYMNAQAAQQQPRQNQPQTQQAQQTQQIQRPQHSSQQNQYQGHHSYSHQQQQQQHRLSHNRGVSQDINRHGITIPSLHEGLNIVNSRVENGSKYVGLPANQNPSPRNNPIDKGPSNGYTITADLNVPADGIITTAPVQVPSSIPGVKLPPTHHKQQQQRAYIGINPNTTDSASGGQQLRDIALIHPQSPKHPQQHQQRTEQPRLQHSTAYQMSEYSRGSHPSRQQQQQQLPPQYSPRVQSAQPPRATVNPPVMEHAERSWYRTPDNNIQFVHRRPQTAIQSMPGDPIAESVVHRNPGYDELR